MLTYPVDLTKDDNGTILATVHDVPEIITFGLDEEEAVLRVTELLADCLGEYMSRRLPIPAPSRTKRGMRTVTVPPIVEAKVELYGAMQAEGMGKAELARRLNWHLPQVDRVLDLNHNSRLDQIEAALRAVGKKLVISVEDAA